MHLPPFDRTTAITLLNASPKARLSAYQIASKAHRRWDLKQHEEAALLFCMAFERAQREFATGEQTVDQSPNYFVRAAVNLALAGKFDTAEPMLDEVTRFDWQAANLMNDSHMTEWAFGQLLEHAQAGSKEEFTALFERAVCRGRELGREFPSIHPIQEKLLRQAMDLALPAIAGRIVALIKLRRPISREARALLGEAEKYLSASAGPHPV